MKAIGGNSDGSWDKELLNTDLHKHKELLVIYYRYDVLLPSDPYLISNNYQAHKCSVDRGLGRKLKNDCHIWVKMLLNRSRIHGARYPKSVTVIPTPSIDFGTF